MSLKILILKFHIYKIKYNREDIYIHVERHYDITDQYLSTLRKTYLHKIILGYSPPPPRLAAERPAWLEAVHAVHDECDST